MKSDMENKDWLDEYMSLKQINPDNPFTVPAGYFDDLGDRIVAFRNLDELKDKGFSDGFTVPENYFEELTGNIQSRIAVESTVNLDEPGFAVPEGYFEGLQQQIQSRIFVEEALGEPAEQFTVPEGYFNKLTANILDKTVNEGQNQPVVKNRGIIRRLYTSTAFKYATAACFALALGGGILLSELTGSVVEHKGTFLHQELSGVPVDDIKSYLELNLDPSDTQQKVAADDVSIDDVSLENALQKDISNAQ
ncbi:hypothetical protein [Mucilaginibacter xinganensis]|uniref:Uncharacterized protein n=1 Tax=Mucilaginibacter xinganensis TaxID=1234841 RepID=A0A223NTQ6_9SPHI|nr:hypothetical protein [Mucilaginibacter xinganensis]ASU33237.1 hypothetical protein MuYL_1339 [Mucilaginibacter xinganensis]